VNDAAKPPPTRSAKAATVYPTPLLPAKPAGLSWRDYLITLLRIGGEIEHALMVQYLYAAYSLGGPAAEKEPELVRDWRDTLLTIAREEMGHLITVQNLLLLLGGPVSFERHSHPWSSPFYPFEFNLDGLSLESLARYVYAEMPTRLRDRHDRDVREKVVKLLGKDKPIEVGVLYDHIITLMADRKEIPDSVFDPGCYHYQVTWDEFGRGYRPGNEAPHASETNQKATRYDRARVIVAQVVTRTDALAALKDVAGQGEAEHYAFDDSDEPSHFERFAGMFSTFYDRCEQDKHWSPSLPVPLNPSSDQVEASSTNITPIRARASQIWGQLFNFRYRMLLLLLTYIYRVQREPASRLTSLRAQVLGRIFGEMYHMKAIAGILVRMPLDDSGSGKVAGPPFQLPFSLALPQGEENFWRGQLGLLDASAALVKMLQEELKGRSPPEGERFLQALSETDRDAHAWICRIVSSGAFGWRIG